MTVHHEMPEDLYLDFYYKHILEGEYVLLVELSVFKIHLLAYGQKA